MALQTQDLVMIGLGSVGDTPPDDLQPPLRDGIHLRWSFARANGFPWHGFYLFRRESGRMDPICLLQQIDSHAGPLPDSTLALAGGAFSSDQRLLLTDSFAPTGKPELDLSRRKWLRYRFDPAKLPRSMEIVIGVRPDASDAAEVAVVARYKGRVVAKTTLAGRPGDIVGTLLTVDIADEVEFAGAPASLIELCFTPFSHGATSGWKPVPDCRQPIALPVSDPNYPASPGAPDEAAARQLAGERVFYGDPSDALAEFSDLHESLQKLVMGGAAAGAMVDRLVALGTRQPTDGSGDPPVLTNLRVIDLVLLASLHRAAAETLGLSWTDQTPEPGRLYDYLIVTSPNGVGAGSTNTILHELATHGFANLDGWIVFNQRLAASPPLAPPEGLRLYALPGASLAAPDGSPVDATNNAGLVFGNGGTPVGGAVLELVWRARLGDGDDPVPATYELVTTEGPIVVTSPLLPPAATIERADDWPPFAVDYVDRGLEEGWYGYALTGIDLFGRHSKRSEPGDWWQWAPSPEPEPWYQQAPSGDRVINVGAIRLLDKTPPPPPVGVEASALDGADPTIVRDGPFNDWWASLSPAERDGVVGLRVRWRWTADQMRQAPDTAEFRIYYRPGRANTLACAVTEVASVSPSQSDVTVDLPTAFDADVFVGATLRLDNVAYAIAGSSGGAPPLLRLDHPGPVVTAGTASVSTGSATVTGTGTSWHPGLVGLRFKVAADGAEYRVLSVGGADAIVLDRTFAGPSAAAQPYQIFEVRPAPSNDATIIIPEAYAHGTVSASTGSALVQGAGTSWNATLAGQKIWIAGGRRPLRVATVNNAGELLLDRPFDGPSGGGLAYAIRFPLFTDLHVATNWAERLFVVGYDEHVEVTVDSSGRPLRLYELFLPAAGDADRAGLPLVTTLAEPIAYADIGVTAADGRPHTPDDPVWAAGGHGGRHGNESIVSAPSRVARVRREPPPPPIAPGEAEKVFATPADYHGLSFYTVRWTAAPHLRTHIYRALDESLYALDRRRRPRPPLDVHDDALFPAGDPRWGAPLRKLVAGELDALNGFAQTPAGEADALAAYRALSSDALRILAGLPGIEQAFTQRTIVALDADDPANADRRGPDNSADYAPDPALRAWLDTIDGRGANRYFYRAAFVDGANNVGPMGVSSAPVWLPKTVAPASCVVTRVLGADRAISLSWRSNREPDLAGYRIYRAEAIESARDLRLMTLVHEIAVPPGQAEAQPVEQTFTDAPVPGLRTFHYVIVAVDDAGNVSAPHQPVAGRAHDLAIPVAPTPAVAWTDVAGNRRATISWTSDHETMLQRREGGRSWVELATWRQAGTFEVRDPFSDVMTTYEYRLWARSETGAVGKGAPARLEGETHPFF